MKYYEEHELAYQQLMNEGYVGWGQKKSIEELLDFSQKSELDQFLNSLLKPAHKILDLGCGSGPIAFHLASQGYEVTGIDVSKTAIDLARRLAAELNLRVDFVCGDFLDSSIELDKFSFIIDSSFLHCIVFDEERKSCVRHVYDLLEPDGVFVLHAMVSDDGFDFGDRFLFDDQGVLLYLNDQGVTTPQRRILSSEQVREEIHVRARNPYFTSFFVKALDRAANSFSLV